MKKKRNISVTEYSMFWRKKKKNNPNKHKQNYYKVRRLRDTFAGDTHELLTTTCNFNQLVKLQTGSLNSDCLDYTI